MEYLNSVWIIWLDLAPMLFIGLVLSGIIHSFIPEKKVIQFIGKGRWGSVFRATIVGAPLPLCSCSVVPVAMGLNRKKVPKGAVSAFFISTPETGVDSVLLSYTLLGPIMAIIRPIATISASIMAGLLVNLADDQKQVTKINEVKKSCCEGSKPENTSRIGIVKGFFHFSFIKLLQDMVIWLVFGTLVAAFVVTFLPQDFLQEWGQTFFSKLIMIAIGLPMYICASASTPIAASMMAAGVSAGTALVFLLAGPATNLGTFGIIKKELGKKAAWIILLSILITALIFGVLLDTLFPDLLFPFKGELKNSQIQEHSNIFSYALSLAMLPLTIYTFIAEIMTKLKGGHSHS